MNFDDQETEEEINKRIKTRLALIGILNMCIALGIRNRFTNAEDAHALELLCEEAGISCYIHDHYRKPECAFEMLSPRPSHFTVEPLVA